ncbi:MAG: flavodoxin-dependent (E)-4-hydroxy-3-methylbut-2-enyl-diphosphate synthase [Candidatus Dormibacteraeota bacterium]|nr:flavodoxin-dependent (E)-4-hydroxy-3-methylbut-2-enyl-diphosphate synthase [Candidatus Dormibacteraeota bacterium]MBV9524780.1 flavodoxin-dependent (E)-4-hydroxy-3-methylbut-2-enyl-diphosphate synthase [Candidatus Dormibacteraeota bacterium]
MANRRPTVPVNVGGVVIGGAAPIPVQTMTKTQTEDVSATLAQIERAAKAGADIIRVTCDTREAGNAMREIVRESPIPIVADIHYDAPLALMALEAGVQCLRLNPGNITDRDKVAEIAREAKARDVPMRIGVNAGSIPQRKELTRGRGATIEETAQRMVDAAMGHIRILEELDFRNIKVSLKASDVLTNLAANRKFAALGNRYPLHLGLTEAGPVESGSVKSAMGIGILLAEGIGDTIRVSLVGEPEDEVRVGRQILANLQEKGSGPNLVACPTCGRLEIDMFPMVKRVEEALAGVKRTITVSVMGCVVNGPGEGMHADIGIAGGRQKGILYRGGKVIATLPEDQLIDTLVEELHRIADEDARLLAEGKPLPSGAGDESLARLPVSAG